MSQVTTTVQATQTLHSERLVICYEGQEVGEMEAHLCETKVSVVVQLLNCRYEESRRTLNLIHAEQMLPAMKARATAWAKDLLINGD